MGHLTYPLAAGLVGFAVIMSSAAPPAYARDGDEASPDVKTIEEKLERMQREMEEMRRQLEKMRRREPGEEAQEPGEDIERQPVGADAKEKDSAEGELERLRRLAEEEARPEEEDLPAERSFIARGLGLQALNPEISPAGDFLMSYRTREGERSDTDFEFRALDIHLQSYLDPFSKMKAAVEIHSSGAELGEAYFTRFAVLSGLNVTAGKFRQQFGVVNRWHKHALDQIDFPLALRQIFGEGGLNQTGLSIEWTPPGVWGASHEAMVQVTEGENDRLFGQNSRHLPSVLARYKNYRDLSKDTYLDIGLTGLTGWNDEWQIELDDVTYQRHDTRESWALGADVSVRWEPTERMRYASFEWRTEFYYLNKGISLPYYSCRDRITAWGGYTSLQRQISRTVEIGARMDYFDPDSEDYTGLAGLAPLAVEGKDPYQWQVGPYITWWQSPWVRLRLELDYFDGHNTGDPGEFVCTAQAVFAAGPHKHERY